MAKPRKLKKKDKALTELLNMPGLTAIGGNEHDIEAMSPDTAMPVCAECGGSVENHGRFARTLIDIVSVDGEKQFARLHYYFYKYRCLNPECGAVFQKPIEFVKENSKTTKRYEDEVLRHVMYESLDKAREDMADYIVHGCEDDLISKPAMSKLVKRWVRDKDEARKFVTPQGVLIYTYEAYHKSYTVICELDDRPLAILEVFPFISASAIREFFSKIEPEYLAAVIIDGNPVVYETLKEIIKPDRIWVDTDAIKQILLDEYDACVFERAKNYSKEVRKNLRSTGANLDVEDAAKVYNIRRKDKVLQSAYKKYAELYVLLQEHRDIFEVKPWMEDLSEEDRTTFSMTLFYLDSYWPEIVNYYKRRNDVSGSRYEKLYELNQKIEQYFSQCTDDVFRARMLYSDFKEFDNKTPWHGIPVDDLLDILDDMITEGGLKKHERKRRQN